MDATNPASPASAGAVALPRNSELGGVFTPGVAFSADARYVFVGNNFIGSIEYKQRFGNP